MTHLFPSILATVPVLQDAGQSKRLLSITAGQERFPPVVTYDVEGDHPSPPLPPGGPTRGTYECRAARCNSVALRRTPATWRDEFPSAPRSGVETAGAVEVSMKLLLTSGGVTYPPIEGR